jgi:hypothetical protein
MRLLRAAIVAVMLATAATCGPADGEPGPPFCPVGTVVANVCVACGPVAGCLEMDLRCARPCNPGDDCPVDFHSCVDGFCQNYCPF